MESRALGGVGIEIPPALVGQHHGSVDLTIGDGPIAPQEPVLLFGRNELEAVALVETDGPVGRRPGADESGPRGFQPQLLEQLPADAAIPLGRADIGMTDESHVLYVLDAHDAEQLSGVFIGPE